MRPIVSYTCEKCNYTTNRKSNYISHMNRKTPCVKGNTDRILTETNIIDSVNDNTNKHSCAK